MARFTSATLGLVLPLTFAAGTNAAIIAHHTFDNDASDAFGRGATAYGGATIGEGVVGNALHLDGTGYVRFDVKESLNNLSAFTLAVWVKVDAPAPTAGDPYRTIYATDGWGPGQGQVHLNYEWDNNNSRYRVKTAGPDGLIIETPVAGVPTGWFHTALTFDGTTYRLLIDGVEQASFVGANLNNLGDAAILGAWDGAVFGLGINRYLTGAMDDLRIYDEALDASAIAGLIPEPASAALVGLGAMLMLGRGRRN